MLPCNPTVTGDALFVRTHPTVYLFSCPCTVQKCHGEILTLPRVRTARPGSLHRRPYSHCERPRIHRILAVRGWTKDSGNVVRPATSKPMALGPWEHKYGGSSVMQALWMLAITQSPKEWRKQAMVVVKGNDGAFFHPKLTKMDVSTDNEPQGHNP